MSDYISNAFRHIHAPRRAAGRLRPLSPEARRALGDSADGHGLAPELARQRQLEEDILAMLGDRDMSAVILSRALGVEEADVNERLRAMSGRDLVARSDADADGVRWRIQTRRTDAHA